MAHTLLKFVVCAVIGLSIGFTKLYSAKVPFDFERFKGIELEDFDSKMFNMIVPQNLSRDDKPVYVILKFIGHNAKNLRDKEFFRVYEKAITTLVSPSFEYSGSKKGFIKLPDQLDLELHFNADWPKRLIRFYMITAKIKSEMAYVIGSNKFVFSISKDLIDGVNVSIMNTKELSTDNSLYALNVSFDF